MCGISGIFSFNDKQLSSSHVADMILSQRHRGPDSAFLQPFFRLNAVSFEAGHRFGFSKAGDYRQKASAWLGHARLSIIDTSDVASQPMSRRGLSIVFNGEIFNYLELRDELQPLGYEFETRSDTEVLLAAYSQWGSGCLRRLNGMFAFFIFDSRNGTIFAARDRFGIKPFFYSVNDDLLVIASEIKGIMSSSLVSTEWDDDIVWMYLAFHMSMAPEGRTFFRNIMQLPPGHCMSVNLSTREIVRERYYDVRRSYPLLRFHDACERARELIKDSCRLRMRSDRQIGLCLSSGVDSSNVAAALMEEHSMPACFSIQASNEVRLDEFPLIEELCRSLGITTEKIQFEYPIHTRDMVRYILYNDEPVYFFGSYNQYYLYREMRKRGAVVTMSGHGGDELFCGYQRYYPSIVSDLMNHGKFLRLAYWILKNSLHLYNDRTQVKINWQYYASAASWMAAYEREIQAIPFKYYSRINPEHYIEEFIGAKDWLQQCLKSVFHYELQYLLRDADRNSMANGVEERVPLLDHRLFEFCVSQRVSLLCHGGYLKGLARRLFTQLPKRLRFHQVKRGLYTDISEAIPDLWKDLRPVVLRSPLLRRMVDVSALPREYPGAGWWRLLNLAVIDASINEKWVGSCTINKVEDKQIDEYIAK